MKWNHIIVGGGIIVLLGGSNADAYIDPNQGSMILQVLIGLLAGFGLAVKIYWTKIKDLFFKKKPDE